jgi:hypothetical protein
MIMNKVKSENFTQAISKGKMHPKMCTLHNHNIIRVCPISFPQKCTIVLYIGGLNACSFMMLP